LSTINWGSQLKSISRSAFYGCTSLTSLTIPNTVTTIDNSAFYGCSSITSLTIGSKVTSIGFEAFRNCTGLKSVSIPNSVTSISTNAFRDCTRITSVTMGTGLSEIPERCFAGCKSLETVSIGANVINIGISAFDDCPALSTINWGSQLKSISRSAFYGCTSLTSLTIPNTVTTIDNSAFYGCSGIRELTIGDKVTSIGYEAFKYCTGLKEVVIPEKVTGIGGHAFGYCDNIAEVYFPASLQTVGSYAFNGCEGITDVYYESSESDWGYVTIEKGNEPITNAIFHDNYTEKPTVSIISTNNLAVNQTVTLKMSDNVGVVSYYWGISSSPSSGSFTSITSATSKSITKTVSDAGTYYLFAKDAVGNVSTTASVTFYKTTFNGNKGSVSPSYVITKSGNSFNLPMASREGYTFLGWSSSSNATSADYSANSSYKPTGTKTLYAVWEKVPEPIVLKSIEVYTNPTKTIYYIGDSLNTSGLTIKLIYSDDSTETLTSGFAVSGFNSSTAGTKTVTVTYKGKTTTFNVTVTEPVIESDAVISVTSATGRAGNQVSVNIVLSENPGVTSMLLSVDFDEDVLRLVNVTDAGLLGSAFHSNNYSSPYSLSWANDTATSNFTVNGSIVTLTFEILDSAEAGETAISVNYDYNNYDIIDKDLNRISFATKAGKINVTDVIIGDVNGDGTVNTLDRVILTRYIANWTEYIADDISLDAADVNADGVVNTLDRVILTRHIANWSGYESLPY